LNSKDERRYRSKLESLVGGLLGPEWDYEPFKVPYVTHRNYNPDFVLGSLLVEVKGFFRVGDTQKYKAIRDALVFQELVFFLQSPRSKVRKGAKLTMAEWCEKEHFVWFDNVSELKSYGEMADGHF
jgi:hypothetical protein